MQIRNAKYEDLKAMCNLWNEVVSEEYFLKPFTQEEYEKYYLALKQYCQQDTWAMVEILWGLKEYIKGK